MVGIQTYEDLIAPSVEKEIDFFDYSIYHLDGVQALRHLPRILQMKKLNGVQWVAGTGQKSARFWIDTLKQIQQACKNIHIQCEIEDIKPLCENLSPKGLLMRCQARSEDEAKQLEKMVSSYAK